jgi:hypothetical protein
MEKLKYVARRVREPTTWLALSLILGLFGLPAPVVQALGAVLDIAPGAIDAAAAIAAAGAAALLPEQAPAPVEDRSVR